MILAKSLIYSNHIDFLLSIILVLRYQVTNLTIFQLIELKIVLV